jgi:diguanylate cyclase (GGDEF)-like protein
MQDLNEGVTVGRGRLSAFSDEPVFSSGVASSSRPATADDSGTKVGPFIDQVAVVPGQRLLEMASVLSDGAALMHARLRHLGPEDRDAILDLMAVQLSEIVTLWTDLVRGVVASPAPDTESAAHDRAEFETATDSASDAESSPDLPSTETHPSAHLFSKAPTFGVPTIGAAAVQEPGPGHPTPGVRRLPRRDVVTSSRELGATPLRSVKVDETAPDPECDPDGDYENDRLTRDELTGVLNRQAGFAALGRDLDRCRRAGERFVLGYLDVDGLKEVNSAEGPRGGDELLRKVTAALRATLRSYDVIMRLGGDEFLFSLPGADMATAELRANEFGVILAEEAAGGSASVGFSELRGNDTLDEIISRAEIELVKNRRSRVRSR